MTGGATNIHWHAATVTRAERARANGHAGATIWLTGLSGSGKSTIACALETALTARGIRCYRLDGDNLRTGLNKDLGFDDAARAENVRSIGEVARLFADAGVVAIVGAISPSRAERAEARRIHEADRDGAIPFLEVHVHAPLAVCESRDPKGLYKKARAGEIKAFTGIDSAYEPPERPALVLETSVESVEACVARCVDAIVRATA